MPDSVELFNSLPHLFKTALSDLVGRGWNLMENRGHGHFHQTHAKCALPDFLWWGRSLMENNGRGSFHQTRGNRALPFHLFFPSNVLWARPPSAKWTRDLMENRIRSISIKFSTHQTFLLEINEHEIWWKCGIDPDSIKLKASGYTRPDENEQEVW